MKHPSVILLVGLVAVVAVLSAVNLYLPQGEVGGMSTPEELPAPRPVMALASVVLVLVIYGGLGVLGRHLALKLGFPDLLDPTVSHRQRFGVPALWGIVIGLVFIALDAGFARLHGLGPLPHPPFPTSLVASLVAGIGEELIFRLFFISFWVWLISHVVLKQRGQTTVFWVITAISALAFAAGHLPSVMMLMDVDSVSAMPPALLVELFVLNGIVSVAAAYYFRRAGYVAAISVHFWTDVIWHVLWGTV